MSLSQPLRTYLEALSAPETPPGPASAPALAGAAAAALVALSAREAAARAPGADVQETAATAQAARQDLERAIETPPADLDALLATAERCAGVLDLAVRVFGHPAGRTRENVVALVTAVSLARAATDGAAQNVLLQLDQVPDAIARTSYKTRASGVSQRARRGEADFLLSLATAAAGPP